MQTYKYQFNLFQFNTGTLPSDLSGIINENGYDTKIKFSVTAFRYIIKTVLGHSTIGQYNFAIYTARDNKLCHRICWHIILHCCHSSIRCNFLTGALITCRKVSNKIYLVVVLDFMIVDIY